MKHRIFSAFCLVVALSFVNVGAAHALSFQNKESVTVKSTEVIDGALYASGKNITVDGVVKGDVFCAGETITIAGQVEGDVLCAGQDVIITGWVTGDLRVATKDLVISGMVEGSTTAFAQKAQLTNTAQLGRDTSIWAKTVKIEAQIMRDLFVSAGDVTLASGVGRDVTLWADVITLSSGAVIIGDLTYTSDQAANIETGAIVNGQTTHTTAAPAKVDTGPILLAGGIIAGIFWLLATALLGALIIFVRATFLPATAATIVKKPWATLGWGLIGLVGTPVLAVVAMLTFIGLPVGFVLLLLWLMALCLGGLLGAHALGWLVLSKIKVDMHRHPRLRQLVALVVGLLIITVLGAVPFVGGFVSFLALVWGIGSLSASFKKAKPESEVVRE